MSSIPISTAYVKHWKLMTEKKMESRINLTEENERKQRTQVVVQQRPFNNTAAFCKAPDMISKASIEMAKLILFAV